MKTRIEFEGSSCLASGIYDGRTRELDLVFRSNERKHYIFEADDKVVGSLVGSDSPGSVYHQFIAGVEKRSYEEVS
jgi:hypothetical protein